MTSGGFVAAKCCHFWTSFDSFALRNTVFVSCIRLTSLIPVQMGDVVHWAFAHTNPLAAHHVVNIHKAVTWCHSQILACYCNKNQFFSFEPYHDPAITFLVILWYIPAILVNYISICEGTSYWTDQMKEFLFLSILVFSTQSISVVLKWVC